MTMVNKPEDEKTLTVKDEGLFHKISIAKLNELGYELTGKQRLMGGRPYRFALLAVRNEGDKGEASFCFLYSHEDNVGVVLPKTFDEYVKALKTS